MSSCCHKTLGSPDDADRLTMMMMMVINITAPLLLVPSKTHARDWDSILYNIIYCPLI